MTLQELSDAWNDLRNAALGRSTTPNVPGPLAADVGNAWDAWRRWLAEQGSIEDWIPSVTANEWVTRYRALLERVRRAGVQPSSELSSTPLESVKEAAIATGSVVANVAKGLEGLLWGAAGLLIGGAAFVLARGRRA